MGYKREDGTFDDSCLEKAKPGEPLFVLRAQDLSAPGLVELWADLARERLTIEETSSTKAKIEEAYKQAAAMRRWATEHGGKWPD